MPEEDATGVRHIGVYLTVGITLSVLVGMFFDSFFGEPVVFGGMDCGPPGTNGIKSCVGYVPAGLAVIMFVVTPSVVMIGQKLERVVGI